MTAASDFNRTETKMHHAFSMLILAFLTILGVLAITLMVLGLGYGKASYIISGSLTVLLIGATVTFMYLPVFNENETVTDSYPLQAITTSTEKRGEAGGNAFLITGQINEEAVYRFYRETGPNQYRLETVDADYATIVEDDAREVRYITVKGFFSDTTTVELHVPTGSVTSDFNLALPN